MRILYIFLFFVAFSFQLPAQSFERSELNTELTAPWEITYGPDDFLWITESEGQVSRVHPISGDKMVVYTASDYFAGSPLEAFPICHNPPIGRGTLGLALHPDFLEPSNAYIYFVYSYNQGTEDEPATHFRIKRLLWDAVTNTVIDEENIINAIPSSFDHWGGRLMAIKQNGIPYLFYTLGDLGLSEINSPDCYPDQSLNPNNLAQAPGAINGKVHRFNMDGSIPADNPLPDNSFYTRGHRNPQGLMYNPNLDIIYNVEHGDRTDDEINILYKGMNYGWKDVRGYHGDNNYPGESDYIANYVPNSSIENDALIPPLYSWCIENDTTSNNANWCTVAPCDGIYYGLLDIVEWANSLLVVTLKNGQYGDREVYQFKLDVLGQLVPSTAENPNPKRFFGEDQALNGRLRDITFSPNGRTIYLINQGGAPTDKITVYTQTPTNTQSANSTNQAYYQIFPNPVESTLFLHPKTDAPSVQKMEIFDTKGALVYSATGHKSQLDISQLRNGLYYLRLTHDVGQSSIKFIKN